MESFSIEREVRSCMRQGNVYKGLLIVSCAFVAVLNAGCGRPVHMNESDSVDQSASSAVDSEANRVSYNAQREALLAQELVADQLSSDELRLDERLQAMKKEAFALYGQRIPYGINEWSSSMAADTRLHAFCADVPKGGNLHVHDASGISADGLIDLLLDRGDVLVNVDEQDGYGKLYFDGSPDVPETAMPLRDALGIMDEGQREEDESQEEDDRRGDEEGMSEEQPVLTREALRDMLTLGGVSFSQDAWAAMGELQSRIANLMADDSFVRALYEAGFREQVKSGIDLVELRFLCGEDDQTNARLLHAIRDAYYAVKRDRSSFVVRVVACANKETRYGKDAVCNVLRSAIRLATQVRDETDANDPKSFIVGLDLVGNEDSSWPLKEMADFLGSDEVSKSGLALYLHCGESIAVRNDSVADAYLLGARRIGHGISLYRYPALMDSYEKDAVAIEVSPMSDFRLGYVSDLRLHPGALYLRNGNQVVLCSDAGTLVEPAILVDDFYAATLCWDMSLADIKALCRNSITYSSLSQEEKKALMAAWETQWDAFVKAQLAQAQ